MKRLLWIPLLAAAAWGGEETGLDRPPQSMRAKQLREEADKRWKAAEPVWSVVNLGKEPEAAAVPAAIAAIEDAASAYERSLEAEWNAEANLALRQVVHAWFRLHGKFPPPESADPKEKERLQKERRDRLSDARRFVMDYGSARRYENQLERCHVCDGKKMLVSAFGDQATPCARCGRSGVLPSMKGILAAHWLPFSPLYRANSRNSSQVDRWIRTGHAATAQMGPFVRSIAINGDIEDHDTWVRVHVTEKVVKDPASQKPDKVMTSYALFRVGRVWYLWDERTDRDLIDVPSAEAPAKE